jgi:hypothetical protein
VSRIRSIVCGALLVCRVEKTRWPVSAAVITVATVSGSRISPTMMTSGSCRMALRNASEKAPVSVPTSRWEMDARSSENRNSIGSSMVITCTGRFFEMCRITAASVVDLPLPVGPVTRTSPMGRLQNSRSTFGRSSSSRLLIWYGMRRKQAAMFPRCM